MNWQQIKALNEQRGQALADMKSILKTAEDEKRDLNGDENTKFDGLNKRAEDIKSTIDRYEQAKKLDSELAERRQQQPGREDVNTPESQADDRANEARSQFISYLRTGTLPSQENRALTVSGVGVVGPRAYYDQLIKSLNTFSGVRDAGATVLPTSDGNDLTVPRADDTSNIGQIVGEAVEDNTEADPTLTSITLKAYKFDSKWVKVSLEMLQDSAFPIESYINSLAGERIGRAFNAYATTGTGIGQPKGILTAGTLGKTAATANAITYDDVLDLVHSVDAGYRNSPNFKLMFHDSTLAALRKMKDGAGAFIFAGGVAGAPSRVLDYAYTINNDMPTLANGTGSKVVAAGDFGRYFIRDVTGVTVVRATELFIGSGLIGFRVFSRHDGNLTDVNAIKYLRLA